MFDQILKRTTLFSLFCLGLALVLAACALPQTLGAPQAQGDDTPEEVIRLSLEEARAAYNDGEALFIDVRSASSYASSHIPGALSIPLAELDKRMGDLDPEQWIITYCT